MSDAFWLVAAVILSFAGMAWLALAMEAHWRQVMQQAAGEALITRRMLRLFGATAIALSGLACLAADRPSMAVLVWLMLLACNAATVAMTLATRPATLRWLWPLK